jgi:hypothetical protein
MRLGVLDMDRDRQPFLAHAQRKLADRVPPRAEVDFFRSARLKTKSLEIAEAVELYLAYSTPVYDAVPMAGTD